MIQPVAPVPSISVGLDAGAVLALAAVVVIAAAVALGAWLLDRRRHRIEEARARLARETARAHGRTDAERVRDATGLVRELRRRERDGGAQS